MSKLTFITTPLPHPARSLACRAIQEAPDGMIVTIRPATRSLSQNALMWALLIQLEPLDWYGNHLTSNEWKDVITASIKRQRVVPGIDGGFVVCGSSTSKMSIKDMNEVIEATLAFGITKGITFKENAA